MVATFPGRTQGLGLITEPLLADLQLNRLTYASMNLWATLLGALLCFPAGWAIDRFGLRWVTGGVTLILGVIVWRFGLVAANGALIFLLLLGTRAFGQSALSVCSIATVARWFPQRAGFAMGVYSILLSVLFAGAFGLVGFSLRTYGWRTAWAQIAFALIVLAPVVVLLLKEPSAQGNREKLQEDSAVQLTLWQALRMPVFWIFAGAAAAFNLVSSGLGLFTEAVLGERGFSPKTYHNFLVVSTLMSLAGQFCCGWLTRRWRYQRITFIALLLYGVGLALIPFITRHWELWGLAVLLGAAGGMIIVVFFSVWSDLFGQRHLGRIQGAAQMLTVLSSGLGPVLFAQCAGMFQSYSPLLFVLAAVVVLLAFVAKKNGFTRGSAA